MPFDDAKFAELAEQATEALHGSTLGPVRWVNETGSTNADLLAAGAAGAPHGTILVANHQTAGRGRRDRSWTTAPGDALLVSVLLRPSVGDDALGLLTAAVGVAAAEQCRSMGCEEAQIKWPNDLVVGAPGEHRKLGGILAQSQLVGGSTVVVVGLGLNLVGARLADVGGDAVALDQLGLTADPVSLLVGMMKLLSSRLADVDQGRCDALWARYRELSATLGTRVAVTRDNGSLEGHAVDITPTGALVVESRGERHEVVVGDVASLRPVDGSDCQ